MHDTQEAPARALLLGLEIDTESQASLDELSALVETLGWISVQSILIRQKTRSADLLIGHGKAEEIAALAKENSIDIVVFDVDLSPSQTRNWEKAADCAVTDRTGVIIDIFGKRASTKEAQIQVELASLQYKLPRLLSAYANGDFARQRGGAFGTRGSGETKLELDKRAIKKRMVHLKDELETIKTQRASMRKKRSGKDVPVIGLVGYTNAGKSSLMNALTGAAVLAKDAPFATLDPTARRLLLPNGKDAILIDTVGFIRKLPHGLVHAFRATLEELSHADLLLHVLDLGDPEAAVHYETTQSVLNEIEVGDKPVIVVLNKSDLVVEGDSEGTDRVKILSGRFPDSSRVSARDGSGLTALLEFCAARLAVSRPESRILVPYERGDILAILHREAQVSSQEESDGGTLVHAFIDERIEQILKSKGISIESGRF